MLRCSDDSVYVGLTGDLERRLSEHKSGNGSKHVQTREFVELLWSEHHIDRASAEKRESQIKRWTRRKKLALAVGDLALLKKL